MIKNSLSLFIIFVSINMLACKEELKDDKSRFSYAVGQQVGGSLKNQGMDGFVDVKALSEGIEDAMADKGRLSPEEIRQAIMNAHNRETPEKAEYKKKNEEFLATNKTEPGVQVTPSGLQYKVLKAGKGKKPGLNDKVSVHYAGKLIDGKEFDSSYKRGEPASFPVSGVIKGWQEALQLMNEGSKWQLYIPASIAYGNSNNPSIPGNSTLIFDVELLKVLP